MAKRKHEYSTYEEFLEVNFPSRNNEKETETRSDDPFNLGVRLARESLKKVTKILCS